MTHIGLLYMVSAVLVRLCQWRVDWIDLMIALYKKAPHRSAFSILFYTYI